MYREVKQELDRIENQRVKNSARNSALLRRVQETIEANQQNEVLYRAKESLEEAKRQFLKDLNKKDPLWREKMRTRKLDEIKRLEQYKDRIDKELVERQKQLEDELLLNERIRRMREEVDEQHEQMRAIESQRRSLQLEQEITSKRRELEDIERKLNEQRRDERDLV